MRRARSNPHLRRFVLPDDAHTMALALARFGAQVAREQGRVLESLRGARPAAWVSALPIVWENAAAIKFAAVGLRELSAPTTDEDDDVVEWIVDRCDRFQHWAADFVRATWSLGDHQFAMADVPAEEIAGVYTRRGRAPSGQEREENTAYRSGTLVHSFAWRMDVGDKPVAQSLRTSLRQWIESNARAEHDFRQVPRDLRATGSFNRPIVRVPVEAVWEDLGIDLEEPFVAFDAIPYG